MTAQQRVYEQVRVGGGESTMGPLNAVFDAVFDNDNKKWVWVFQIESCRDIENSILAGSNAGFESTIRSGLRQK
jgi:hypothetical protein